MKLPSSLRKTPLSREVQAMYDSSVDTAYHFQISDKIVAILTPLPKRDIRGAPSAGTGEEREFDFQILLNPKDVWKSSVEL